MSEFGITVSTIDRLLLPQPIREAIMVHLLHCAPNEGVGMLGVRPPFRTENETIAEAVQFVSGSNVEQSPVRYTMDPHDVITAFREFREQRLLLGAIVHSHLQGPATPSVSDVNEWNYPEALMMIASFAHLPAVLKAWRLVENDGMMLVQPVPIDVIQDS